VKEWAEGLSDGSIRLSISKTLYDPEAVLKTSHLFTDRCYIDIGVNDNDIVLFFKPKEGTNGVLQSIVDDFLNELIDQQVRAIVQRECHEIRVQIIRRPFRQST